MQGELPDGWDLAGLWHDGEYYPIGSQNVTDAHIDESDAIVVSFHGDDWADGHYEYVTLHAADGWDSLYDLVDDIDEDVYFG